MDLFHTRSLADRLAESTSDVNNDRYKSFIEKRDMFCSFDPAVLSVDRKLGWLQDHDDGLRRAARRIGVEVLID